MPTDTQKTGPNGGAKVKPKCWVQLLTEGVHINLKSHNDCDSGMGPGEQRPSAAYSSTY
jgi:hypothetical protein